MNWKRNLYILWFTQVLSVMSFGFGIPLMPFYIQELGVTEPDLLKIYIGIVNSMPAVSMAIVAPIWGKLSDRFGRKPMILRAMISASIILTLMGMAPNVNSLVFLRAVQGLFTGTIAAASTFVAAGTPRENLSYALGFLSTSSFLGSSIGQVLGGLAAEAYGNRVSFYIGGGIMIVGATIAFILLKEDPSTFGKSEKSKGNMHFRDLMQIAGILLVMIMLQRFVRSIFDPFLPLYLEELHGPEKIRLVNGYVRMGISLATAFAGVTLTRIQDKKGSHHYILSLLVATLLVSIALFLIDGFWPFVILFTLLSYLLGGIEPIITSMSASRVDSRNRGTLFGFQGTLGSMGWMIAPMAGSFLTISYNSYKVLFIATAVVLIINMAMVYFDKKANA